MEVRQGTFVEVRGRPWLVEAVDDREHDFTTHGAACHGCLLIAETSCEMRNLFLDRNLLVPTMANDGSSFFDRPQ